MEPSFDEYAAILKTFYQKVTKQHASSLKLNRDFGIMVAEFSKNDNASLISRSPIKRSARDRDDVSVSGSAYSASKSQRSYRSNIKGTKTEYLFQNISIDKVFLFAYLHRLISNESFQTFNMLEAKMKLLIESAPKEEIQKIGSDASKSANIWSNNYHGLKKITQLFSHKGKVRWEKILGEIIVNFHQIYISIFLRAILNEGSESSALAVTPERLPKIANQIKFTITYFDYENGVTENKVTHGSFKEEIFLGCLVEEKKYAYFEKLPQDLSSNNSNLHPNSNKVQPRKSMDTSPAKQEGISNLSARYDSEVSSTKAKNSPVSSTNISSPIPGRKSSASYSLTKRKAFRTITSLLGEYNANTLKLSDELECLQEEFSREAQIKKKLMEPK